MTKGTIDSRLIMFLGCPGAGKSTLSERLCGELIARGVPAHWLSEEAMNRLEVVKQFAGRWYSDDPDGPDAFLDMVRSVAADWSKSQTVWITDAFLPAFHWLYGKYPLERLEEVVAGEALILAPLRPLLVYLDADVRTAWARAVAQRGAEWADFMVRTFAGFSYPYSTDGPPRDEEDVVRFLERSAVDWHAALARWPGETVILDTTEAPIDQLEGAILRHLGLAELPVPGVP